MYGNQALRRNKRHGPRARVELRGQPGYHSRVSYPIPESEPQRLLELHQLRLMHSGSEPLFESFAQLAASIMGTPMGMVTLMDLDRQWFKARYNVPVAETPRSIALCNHTLMGDEPVVVPDLTKDDRYNWNPLVTGEYALRFYAGAPLITASGNRLGTLCVVDQTSRDPSDSQVRSMKILAGIVSSALTLQREAAFAQSARMKAEGEFTGFSRLVSGLGDKLRQPVRQMTELLDLILNEPSERMTGEQVRDMMALVRQQLRRLSRLASGIADIEEASGVGAITPVPLDPAPLLDEVARSFGHLFATKRQSFAFDCAPGQMLMADALALRQIAVNLLSNAQTYAPSGARITLTLADGPAGTRIIEFADSGPGIADDVMARLGLETEEATAPTDRPCLGLQLSKRLAEAMGGWLTIRGLIAGGTLVAITLPSAPLPPVAAPPAQRT